MLDLGGLQGKPDRVRVTDPGDGQPATTKTSRGRQREEAKAISRQRLLAATLQILDEDGEGALTTTRVTHLAGLAQASFYVHFENMDELLAAVVTELLDVGRSATATARRTAPTGPDDSDAFRETFRTPMKQLAAHPQIFRIVLRSRLDPGSPIGVWSRAVIDDLRDELVVDLVGWGFPHRTAAQRRRLNLVADGITGMTAEMMLGYLDGRYTDIEEMIDVLVAFSQGYRTFLEPTPAPMTPPTPKRKRAT